MVIQVVVEEVHQTRPLMTEVTVAEPVEQGEQELEVRVKGHDRSAGNEAPSLATGSGSPTQLKQLIR